MRRLPWWRQPLWLALLTTVWFVAPACGQETPLDKYVKEKDATYSWRIVKIVEGNPSRTLIVRLKSQTWRTPQEVDRPVWEHWLTIIVPEKVEHKTAFLMIGGGSHDSAMPERANDVIVQIARATRSVVAELRNVPNQALIFHGDGVPRKEDDLIGYTWDQFLKTGDATWPARLPMVKSAVRAMDCIQEVLASQEGGGLTIEKFVVAGGSKRGWTTWMTAAVDPRVVAIVPIVIDVLNVEPSMRHHAQVYGFWAEAIGNYYQHRILQRANEPKLKELYRIEDPYYYRDRFTMPKFIINGSGDQFFCPDSSQFYFADLPGEKFLRYVPNADHSLKGTDAPLSIIAFYQMVLAGKPRPRFTWTFEKDGAIRVTATDRPKQVTLWQATNPKARDFRVVTIGNAFTSTELQPESDGSWVARITPPKEGWTAFFVELTYDTGGAFPLKLTTGVRVLPDTLPHAGVDLTKVPYEPHLKANSSRP
jgi:PhoPQ-activated pathogenicity-related protein